MTQLQHQKHRSPSDEPTGLWASKSTAGDTEWQGLLSFVRHNGTRNRFYHCHCSKRLPGHFLLDLDLHLKRVWEGLRERNPSGFAYLAFKTYLWWDTTLSYFCGVQDNQIHQNKIMWLLDREEEKWGMQVKGSNASVMPDT